MVNNRFAFLRSPMLIGAQGKLSIFLTLSQPYAISYGSNLDTACLRAAVIG